MITLDIFPNSFLDKADIFLMRIGLKTTQRISKSVRSQEFVKNLQKQYVGAIKAMGFTHKTEDWFLGPCVNL